MVWLDIFLVCDKIGSGTPNPYTNTIFNVEASCILPQIVYPPKLQNVPIQFIKNHIIYYYTYIHRGKEISYRASVR